MKNITLKENEYTPKRFVTRNELSRIYGDKILVADNLIASNYLNRQHPKYYNSGVNGWNYDVYHINGYAIINGYRPLSYWEKLDLDKLQEIVAL